MRIASYLLLFCVSVAVVATSCDSAPAVTDIGSESEDIAPELEQGMGPQMQQVDRPDVVRPPEARQAVLARQIPGFGGYYIEDRTIVVVVTDEADRPAARAIVQASLALEGQNPASVDVVFREGQYEFLDLKQWRDRVNSELFDLPDVVSTSIARASNRIQVGVSNPKAIASAESLLAEGGVPTEAFEFLEEDYNPDVTKPAPVAAASFSGSLRDYQRPLLGGLILPRDGDAAGIGCTLGFVAEQGGEGRLVTNSHCSPNRWKTDYNNYYNHVAIDDSVHYVGLEYYDPAGWNCNVIYKCRNSDAAIIYPGPYVSAALGYIARTTGSGSITFDSSAPTFKIVGTTYWPTQGATVHRMGQRTGWRTGEILNDCKDVKAPDQYHILICQVEASYISDAGDSGAPVFTRVSTNDAGLVGIHHGSSGSATSYFSPLGGVVNDLGSMTVKASGSGGGSSGFGCPDADLDGDGMIDPC